MLKESDSFIIVSPECHGMVPAKLKNFFLYCSRDELAHEPALIVAISAGLGGSYPIAELRISSYKNNRISYLPEHIIIRNVEKFLNEKNKKEFKILFDRLIECLNLLIVYTDSFKYLRKKIKFNFALYPNGM